jgi:FG-GAP-like repeat
MRTRAWLVAAVLPALVLPLCTFGADKDKEPPTITWKKTVLDKTFRSEGAAIGDVNHDGKLDVLVGDVWYEAPDWKMHEIRKPGNYGDGLSGYSECMLCFADDVNGDGWVDEIVIGFPGKPAYWYENPGNKEGLWKEHVIWHSACNETPQYVDLFGTGKRVLVMGWQPLLKMTKGPEGRFDFATTENQGQMAWFQPRKDPTQLWEMHPISVPSAPGKEVPGTQRFSHGLGVGDVNGDKRLDVICTGGWWEQPEKVTDEPWTFHPANLGVSCADIYAADVDGDGKPDLLCSCAHQFGIWAFHQKPAKDGHPEFVREDLFKDLVSETHAMHFVDVNGDGLKDLVTGKRFWSHGKNEPGSDKAAMLYWFEAKKAADGVITFTPHVIDDDSGIGTQFTVADINGDGLLDVIVANKKGVFVTVQQRGK